MAIFTGIGAAVFGAGTFMAGLTAYVLQAAAGIALSYLAQSLAGSDNKKKETENKVRLSLASGEDIPRSFACGLSATAGSLVYFNDWGYSGQTQNAYHTRVIALYDLPTNGLLEVWFKGIKGTLLTGSPHGEFGIPIQEFRDTSGADHVWVKFYDGTQTTADSFLVSRVSTAERPYQSTRVGFGMAYAILTFLDHEEMLKGQMPEDTRFVVGGTKFYDPSKDTTVGGSGAHRADNPATWGGDGDHFPAVQIYNILNGLRYNGAWFYGLQQVTRGQFPVASWIAAINKCRATITGPDGPEPRYRTGGEVRVSVQINDTLSDILTGCQGRISEVGGIYKMFLGAAGAAVVSISDGDISDKDAQSFTPFFGLSNTINGVTAKYPSRDAGFATKVAPPLYRTDLEVKAGNRRLLADVSLDFVPYPGQVQRLMQESLLEAQRARRHTYVLGPEFWILEPGDTLEWTSERNGYVTKLFRVDGVGDQPNLDIIVDLTEVDPADYDWNQATDYRTPTDGVLPTIRLPPLQIVGWSAVPDYYEDADGEPRRPTITVSCSGGMPSIERVWIQVRLKATEQVAYNEDSIRYVAPFAWRLPAVFLPNSVYQARGRYIPNNGIPTEWSVWIDVTTPDIRLGNDDIDITFENIAEEIVEDLKWISEGVRGALENFERLGSLLSEQDLANFNDRQVLSRELRRQVGDLEASFTEIIEVAIGPGGAIAQSLEALYAAMGGNTAEVLVRMGAEVTPVGVTARWGMHLSTDVGETFGEAAFLVQVRDGNSEIILAADRTVVASADGSEVFALFDADGLMVRDITAALITSADGNSFWNLTTGAFRIST